MRAWDRVTQGGSLRPGPAAFAILLAGLLLSLAPVSQRIEAAYYDLLQGMQNRTGSSQVVLINTGSISTRTGTVWDAAAFPDLLAALGEAGARLVIPVEAPPLTMALPDSAQLAALAELELRSRQEGGDDRATNMDPAADVFGVQLAEMRRRSELHSRTVLAAATAGNLIVGVPTFDGARGPESPATSCIKQLLETDSANDDDHAAIRRVRAVVPPSDNLCRASLGAGHVEFWPDADGIVRRIDLLVNVSGMLVPSAALRAVIATSSPGVKAPVVTPGAITWDSHSIGTTGGSAALLRFYSTVSRGPAFETLEAEAVIDSIATARRVAGRIAILGDTRLAAEPGYATPIADRAPPAILLATGLSNLLEEDYLIRPAWLAWLENAMLLLIGIAVLLWGAKLASALAVMTGMVTAVFLLAGEAYLVVNAGIWPQFATVAAFTVFSTAAIRFLQPRRIPAAPLQPPLVPAVIGAPAPTPITGKDDLDLAFSMLRHQPATEHVKQRLYDVALEHARQRDLAKAERVLRHLANLDPEYRNAGEKLKKLAGLRTAMPQPAAPAVTPSLRPVLQPMQEPESLTGRTIGRYEIDQAIGRGAMATVYLGKDPKINRRVAIKTIALAEEFSDTDLANARTQFLREAESAGRLNHPNIISIYDAGEDGQVAYLAMEYFPGKALSFYAQQGHLLPPRRVLELMARAAEALHYAHGQHVVHRDVKPANLLYDAETDTLKITDFGIARLTDTSKTKTGIILGTPSYMSPEQLAGTSVTGQSDLFSLAVTLYQLLTGTPPFRADSIPILMQKIAHERHEPVGRLRNDIPPCVDELLDQALAKDPADRYPSGRAMALALRDCCSSFASPARMQS